MNSFDEESEAQQIRDDEPRPGELERTDIDSDEELDGEVDAKGGAEVRRRNE
jgi:hypothetical protein